MRLTLFVLSLLVTSKAWAGIQTIGPIKLIVTNHSNPVILVQAPTNAGTDCAHQRFFLSKEDKEMFAKLLAANQTGKSLAVSWEVTTAPHVGIHGASGCKLTSVWDP